MKKTRIHASVVILTAFSCLLSAQVRARQSQEDKPLRLKAELVELDVVVTDKAGRPVADLKKEDFVLLEDGKPQQISFFSLIRPTSPTVVERRDAPADAELPPRLAARNLEPGRFIFLILDPYHISRDSQPRLREALIKFIAEDVAPEDQLAIISTSGNLAVFQQVTKNKHMLSLAINAFLGGKADYASAAAIDSVLAETANALGDLASTSLSDLPYKEHALRATLRTLVNVASGVSDVPGRKVAILVSEQLPVRLEGGNSVFDNLFSELQEVIAKSRQGGISFYTLDPRGLVTALPGGNAAEARGGSMLGASRNVIEDPGASADRLLASRTGLRDLAAATGGFAIVDETNLRAGLKKVLADNEAFYMLGYYPENSAQDGKFRRVKIQVKDRPDLSVRSRRGYIAATEKEGKKGEKPESKQDRIKHALGSLIGLRNIKVSILKSEVVEDPKSRERVAKLIIQIDPRSYPFIPAGNDQAASFEVVGFAYDLNNKLANGFSKTLNLKLKPDAFAKVREQGMNLRGEIKLKKSGLYNIRLVVIDQNSGEMGTASDWVLVQK
ncbi:MAG TPA: VWA domain-containing protein [Blastocatellia bacterium]|nr:VWA domain-containing protein [Blastocatellia bacterium]